MFVSVILWVWTRGVGISFGFSLTQATKHASSDIITHFVSGRSHFKWQQHWDFKPSLRRVFGLLKMSKQCPLMMMDVWACEGRTAQLPAHQWGRGQGGAHHVCCCSASPEPSSLHGCLPAFMCRSLSHFFSMSQHIFCVWGCLISWLSHLVPETVGDQMKTVSLGIFFFFLSLLF